MTREADSAVLVDLDSTLADTRHRHHHSPAHDPNLTWDDYASKCSDDAPIGGTIKVVRLLWPHHQIHIVSYRTATATTPTMEWLQRYGVPWDVLKLSTPYDHEFHNHETYKTAYAQDLWDNGVVPLLMLDDWPPVKAAMESVGVPVLVVNPMYDDSTMWGWTPPGVEDPQAEVNDAG